MKLRPTFHTEAELDEFLSRPSPELVSLMGRLAGEVMVLGVAGKMGVTLALQAKRAAEQAGASKRVLGVARFSDPRAEQVLRAGGVETLQCDLLARDQVRNLPRVENVIFMAGRKFGTEGDASLTWAVNTLAPAYAAEHLARSRFVVFSTGCVYPLVAPGAGGCTEQHPVQPIGEYAQSCLGRERVFEHFSRCQETPVCLLRLNYAIDLRYGVLHDLAQTIVRDQEVDLGMGHFNCIWQGDATARALLALDHCESPPAILNVTGEAILSIREVAERLGRALGRSVRFSGAEGKTAYLNNAGRARELFGEPEVDLESMIEWTAAWVTAGGRSFELPTHFQVRDGQF